jgi:cysteine-rich repeat protein
MTSSFIGSGTKIAWLVIALGVGALASVGGCGSPPDQRAGDDVTALSRGLTTPGGFVVVSGDDADDSGHCQGIACGALYPKLFKAAITESDTAGTGIVAIGVNGSFASSSLTSWNAPANGGPGVPVTILTTTAQIASVNFANFKMIYIPSGENNTSGGINATQLAALNARQVDIKDFINVKGGSLLALTEANLAGAWGWLPLPLTTFDPPQYDDVTPTAALTAISPTTTATNMDHCCYHNVFIGPAGFSGLGVLAINNTAGNSGFGKPAILGGKNVILTAEICNDGVDNDGDGFTDLADSDCKVCGNGVVDQAGEECDDGNVVDGDGCSAACKIENHPPTASAGSDVSGDEGGAIALGGSGSDPDGDTLTFAWSYAPVSGVDTGATCSFSAPGAASTTITCTDDGVYQATLTVTDTHGASSSGSALVTVANVAPSLSLTAPSTGALFAVGSTVGVTAPFTDPGSNDTHACSVNWDDGAGAASYAAASGTCDTAKTFTAAGVYTIVLSVTDDDGGSDSQTVMIVVYDPSAGFVTGGGWINSPLGAYLPDPSIGGKANFGFVAKYQKGATVPSGETEFQLHAAGLNLHSESYQWLVVAGARAQFKGTAAVNGVSGYDFLLTIVDGNVAGGGGTDKFRIKVTGPGGLVYDNAPGSDDVNTSGTQVIDGGSIVIHSK